MTPSTDYRELPIVREVLPHTGKLDGDDTGYRDVRVHECDAENPDELVPLTNVRHYPVYARGAKRGITPFYPWGLGAPDTMLVREPVERALIEADQRLQPYGVSLLVVDAWRSATVQAALWRDVFMRLVAAYGLKPSDLTLTGWLGYGRKADDTASFCRIVQDAKYEKAREAIVLGQGSMLEQVDAAAAELGQSADEIADEYLTFFGNYDPTSLTLDTTATTAHGGGGACDIWLVNRATDKPKNLGVPFDSTDPCAVMDFFERPDALERYRERVAADAAIRQYLGELGVERVDEKVIADIRQNRRVLFHAMRVVGATFFSLGAECGEPWHFNFGNERGGRQRDLFLCAGSGCHSLLMNIRDNNGKWVAVWGNAAAHKQAAELLRGA